MNDRDGGAKARISRLGMVDFFYRGIQNFDENKREHNN